MTRRSERREDQIGNSVESCTEATAELWTGGCRVLGSFFGGLSESASRTARRREERKEGDRRDRLDACGDDVLGREAVSSVSTSVSRAVAEAGRTVTTAADICTDSLSCRRDEDVATPPAATSTVIVTSESTPTPPPSKSKS